MAGERDLEQIVERLTSDSVGRTSGLGGNRLRPVGNSAPPSRRGLFQNPLSDSPWAYGGSTLVEPTWATNPSLKNPGPFQLREEVPCPTGSSPY